MQIPMDHLGENDQDEKMVSAPGNARYALTVDNPGLFEGDKDAAAE